MRFNVYLSGIAPTGAPWSATAPADHPMRNRSAEDCVRGLSGGAPVFMATVEIPDNQLTAPPPVEVVAESVGVVAS
jgi:hypothetical protein